MKLNMAVAVSQGFLCVLAVSYVAVCGAGLAPFPGQLTVPFALGSIWVALTVWLIIGSQYRLPFVILSIAELPFTFGWRAWILFLLLITKS